MSCTCELYARTISLNDLIMPNFPSYKPQDGILVVTREMAEQIIITMARAAEDGSMFTNCLWATESHLHGSNITINGNHLAHFAGSAMALMLIHQWLVDLQTGIENTPSDLLFA